MQSPKELNTERARFEEWYEAFAGGIEPTWAAWQARAALSERAATVPESPAPATIAFAILSNEHSVSNLWSGDYDRDDAWNDPGAWDKQNPESAPHRLAALSERAAEQPADHSEQWWLHRIDMEKSAAWQQGYAQGLHRSASANPEGALTDEPAADFEYAAGGVFACFVDGRNVEAVKSFVASFDSTVEARLAKKSPHSDKTTISPTSDLGDTRA